MINKILCYLWGRDYKSFVIDSAIINLDNGWQQVSKVILSRCKQIIEENDKTVTDIIILNFTPFEEDV